MGKAGVKLVASRPGLYLGFEVNQRYKELLPPAVTDSEDCSHILSLHRRPHLTSEMGRFAESAYRATHSGCP